MSQNDLIRESWSQVIVDPVAAARLFYSTLFTIAPATEKLFKSDLDNQGEKLMNTLDFIVDHIDDAETLMPAARELAIRHVAYGVVPADYEPVGAALINTMETALGARFTSDMKDAWLAVYTVLSNEMIRAAYSETA